MNEFAALILVMVYVLCSVGYTTLIKLSGNRLVLFGALNIITIIFGFFFAFLVPFPSKEVGYVILGSMISYNTMLFFAARAYHVTDMSKVYPISVALKYTLVILFGKLLLEETANTFEWIGIIGIGCGILFQINWSKLLHKEDLQSLFFITGMGIFGGLQFCLDIYGTRLSENPFTYIVWSMFLGIPVSVYAILKYKVGLFTLFRKDWKQIIASSFMDNLGYACILLVTYWLKILYVLPISNLSIVVATLIGVISLKESMARQRIASAVLIFLSIAFVQIF